MLGHAKIEILWRVERSICGKRCQQAISHTQRTVLPRVSKDLTVPDFPYTKDHVALGFRSSPGYSQMYQVLIIIVDSWWRYLHYKIEKPSTGTVV